MTDVADSQRTELWSQFGREFDAGSTIFAEGTDADRCFLIQTGRVRLMKRTRQVERSLTILGPGDLFGEGALLSGDSPRSATAIALTDLEALALDRETFESLLKDNATIGTRLVGQLVRRLRDAEEQLENAMLADHPSRVVNTLLRLAARSETDGQGKQLEISPLELSTRVGLDVDTVKRVIQQLRDGGYLRISEERIALPDLGALRRLYDLLGVKEEVRGGVL